MHAKQESEKRNKKITPQHAQPHQAKPTKMPFLQKTQHNPCPLEKTNNNKTEKFLKLHACMKCLKQLDRKTHMASIY